MQRKIPTQRRRIFSLLLAQGSISASFLTGCQTEWIWGWKISKEKIVLWHIFHKIQNWKGEARRFSWKKRENFFLWTVNISEQKGQAERARNRLHFYGRLIFTRRWCSSQALSAGWALNMNGLHFRGKWVRAKNEDFIFEIKFWEHKNMAGTWERRGKGGEDENEFVVVFFEHFYFETNSCFTVRW